MTFEYNREFSKKIETRNWFMKKTEVWDCLFNERGYEWYQKFSEIFASEGAPPVSTTPAVSVAKFTAGVVDTGG